MRTCISLELVWTSSKVALSLCCHLWNVASLSLSRIFSFKRSWKLLMGVITCLYDMEILWSWNKVSEDKAKQIFHHKAQELDRIEPATIWWFAQGLGVPLKAWAGSQSSGRRSCFWRVCRRRRGTWCNRSTRTTRRRSRSTEKTKTFLINFNGLQCCHHRQGIGLGQSSFKFSPFCASSKSDRKI